RPASGPQRQTFIYFQTGLLLRKIKILSIELLQSALFAFLRLFLKLYLANTPHRRNAKHLEGWL
ncbi:MAG: hypothetical protein MRZ59_06350, partial [Clostridiales bacterium]|nr:hypothetical protein [Clostridiales bacterium]